MTYYHGQNHRLGRDELYKELKPQGEIQAQYGEFTSMDGVISELIKNYRKKK